MYRGTKLSLFDFLRLGQEQWLCQTNWAARNFFFRWFGPLGIHTRIRSAHVIQLVETIALPQHSRILDAGCGHAYALFWLARRHPEWKIYGMDIDGRLIANNNRIASDLGLINLMFNEGDVGQLRTDLPFDLILSIDVLEHVADDVHTLSVWRQSLCPTGWLILHLPLRHQMQKRIFPIFKQHTISNHVRDEYTIEEISMKLSSVGFRVCRLQFGFGFWGELAFELNNLFWQQRRLRNLVALLSFPLAVFAGYIDLLYPPRWGNSFIVMAKPA